jgi:O-antigen/teichoic acid export membrane protein
MSVPIIVFLAVGGPSLMSLWMGADYADPWLIGILTLALASEVCYQSLDALLIGLNHHGRPALVMLGAALLAVVFSWIVLAAGGGLVGVALAIGVPWTFAHGIFLPLYACKRLDIRVLDFFRSTWSGPLAHALPFGVILAAARWIFPQQPLYALLAGGFLGGGLMAISYWIWVLPESMKRKILSKLKLRRFAAPRPAAP